MNRKSVKPSSKSVRKKALIALILAFVNGLGFLVLTVQFSNFFVVPFLGIIIIGGIYLLSLRCPRCSEQMYKRKMLLFDIEISYWGGFLPMRCAHCGQDLNCRVPDASKPV